MFIFHHTLKGRSPASIECCVLLQKSKALKVPELKVKWLGFDLPEVYVIGYGLDYAERYRNLPYLAELDQDYLKEN